MYRDIARFHGKFQSKKSMECHNYSDYRFSSEVCNNKQISHAFLFNIRKYSHEVSNIILLRVNNFDIKQKLAWNICFTIYPQHQTKSWVNANKAK